MSQTKCIGLAGYFFGHNFQARITKEFPPGMTNIKTGDFEGSIAAYERFIDALKITRYHGDICSRCGAVTPPATGEGGK